MKALLDFLVNHLDVITGLPAMLVALIALKKYISKRRKNKMTLFLPNFAKICIGRSKEKKCIKTRILSNKSIFIYGSIGIGKTTVIGNTIIEEEKELEKIYDGVLYHKFSLNPSYECACSNLAQQIDTSGTKSLHELLSTGNYLIWLDDCEKTNCLEKILRISYKPVFIVASREKEQEKYLLSVYGSDGTSLMIPTLSNNDTENLLYSNAGWNRFASKKRRSIIHKIALLTNGVPLAISFVKNEKLYKRDPESFYQSFKEEGFKEKVIHPFLDERNELYSMDFLLKRAIGLDVDCQIDRISLRSQKILGFLGCISDDYFPCVNIESIFNYFDKEILQELAKTNLIDIKNNAIKVKHPYIHQLLRDNFGKLLHGDNKIIFDFLDLVRGFFAVGGKNSLELSNSLFSFKYHLLDIIKCVLKNNLITNAENEESFIVGLVILAKFGFYEEVISILSSFKLRYEKDVCRDYLMYAFIRAHEGLEKYDECIMYITQHEVSLPEGEHDSMLVAFHNSLYIYLKSHQYDKLKTKLKEIRNYIDKYHIDLNDKRYKKDLLSITSMSIEFVWHYCDINDMVKFVNEQKDILAEMEKEFDHDDYDIIDAELIFAFSLARIGYYGDVISIFKDIFNSLNNRYSFRDPLAIETARKIAQFYFEDENFNQTNEILQCILPYAVMIWGNEHVITQRLRADYQKNKAKLDEYGFDDSKVLFHISLRPHDKGWIPKVRKFLNID